MKRALAEGLYNIGSLQIRPHEPFIWTSGIQSPVYCDNRLTMNFPQLRNQIAEAFVKHIREAYPDTEVIAGCATAGIPHAAWIAEKLQLPMVYVRSKTKGHGKQNQMEGLIKSGQKTMVIEDLISTGKSSVQAVRALREQGADVQAILAIFTYGLAVSEETFRKEKIRYHTLTNFETLLNLVYEKGEISAKEKEHLLTWRRDPEHFSFTYQG